MPDGHSLEKISKEERKREKYRQRQIEVFDAAAAVFAEKGYHGASTGDIAARLGFAQSSLYYYFKSKDEALEQVCLEGTKGYVDRIENILQSDQSSADKIRAAIHNHIDPVKSIPDYFKTFVGELRYLPQSRRSKLNQMIADYNDRFERILSDGVAEGTFKTTLNPHLSMLLLISQCNTAPFLGKRQIAMDHASIADEIANNFLQGALARS